MKVKEEQLIDLISREVIRQLEQVNVKTNLQKKSILVLGDIELLNECDYDKYNYYTVEDYINNNIEKYEYIIVTEIANYELCDISLGRDSSPVTCAIQSALLLGKNVYLMQSALAFYKYKETSNPKLFNLLEQYVKKLEEFGIIILKEEKIILETKDNNDLDKNLTYDSEKKVITESLAINICKKDKKCMGFPKGTIITPLAKDVFISANKEFILY